MEVCGEINWRVPDRMACAIDYLTIPYLGQILGLENWR